MVTQYPHKTISNGRCNEGKEHYDSNIYEVTAEELKASKKKGITRKLFKGKGRILKQERSAKKDCKLLRLKPVCFIQERDRRPL